MTSHRLLLAATVAIAVFHLIFVAFPITARAQDDELVIENRGTHTVVQM